jgi:hypothetical protein
MDRILNFSHDIDEPRGGIGVLYDHVGALRRNGFDASIVHVKPNFRYPFGAPDVPALDASSGLRLSRDDVVVIPEDHRIALRSCRNVGCRKVLFCQNHYYIFDALDAGEAWRDYGISGYLCVSAPIRDALTTWFGVEADIVRPGVDPIFFDASVSRGKSSPVTIACMPRKARDAFDLVRGLLATVCGTAGPVWREIDGMPRDEVARILHAAHVFVSLGRYEGLGLPPLEAMAAGCLVVGFAGGGGLDYATPDNGVWVRDDDPWALAAALRETLDGLADPQARAALLAKRGAGQATAQRYTRARFEEDLVRYWTAQGRTKRGT